MIMEDDQNNILVKLLNEQKKMSCLCFTSQVDEKLLLQFSLNQRDIMDIRKHVKAFQMFKTHVNIAFD